MRKIILKSVLFVLIVGAAISAEAQDLKYCGTTEAVKKSFQEHPEYLQNYQHLQEFTQSYISGQKKQEESAATVYIIPVVFHIIHNYGPENISDAQVIDAVRVLNNDFRKLNSDTSQIVSAFKGIAADCEIEFRLAQKDPNGNCTNGIDRIVSLETYVGDDGSKLNVWPTYKYLNIWVVSNIDHGAAAYSYLPGTAPPDKDGIMSLSHYVGTIGTGSYATSRTLTHEVGHYLNLLHPWGWTNDPGVSCGNDGVSDTPITMGWLSCNLSGKTCGNTIDNVQNYMEYSYCTRMFTTGQKSMMRAALLSGYGQRNNLWSNANLIATGTNGGAQSVCTPVADFKVSSNYLCEGSSITFYDLSWKGTPSSWNWSFPGGTPSTSTSSNPTIIYSTAGVYNVNLTVSNTSGSDMKIKNSYVDVSTTTPTYNNNFYSDGFEGASIPNSDWSVFNSDGAYTWQQTSASKYSGVKSIFINNVYTPIGEVDELISPSMDLSKIPSAQATFKLAYVQKDANSSDILEISCSVDCGKNWIKRYTKSGSALATASMQGSSFTPSSLGQWRTETINIFPFLSNSNVLFKFKFTSGGGNNIYIDDINITSPAGISSINSSITGLSVYPNPSYDKSVVSFSSLVSGKMNINLRDIVGREIVKIADESIEPGLHTYQIDTEGIKKGIYFVDVSVENTTSSHKLLIMGK